MYKWNSFNWKKLIPYQQRLNNESNLSDLALFINDFNYGIKNRFNTITLILNESTLEKVKQLLKYNGKKLNEKLMDSRINLEDNSDNSDNLSTNTFNSEEDREINKLLE